MPVTTTKPRTNKRTKKTDEVVVSDEEAKPTVTVDATTASESEAVAEEVANDSDSSASVALPIPSKPSSKRSSRTPSLTEEAAVPEDHVHYVQIPPELKERLEYIQHLINDGDEDMLKRMLRVLQAYPFHLVEQENMIRSALAEMNRRVVAHEQHLWAEERAAAAAIAQALKEAAERAAMEAEEKRLREVELAQLAELQAKYCKPKKTSGFNKMCSAIWAVTCITAATLAVLAN
jgi:hypothetical protein